VTFKTRPKMWHRIPLALGVSLLGITLVPTQAQSQSAGSITATVFEDWNQDGVRNGSEPLLAGVTVTASNSAGTPAGTGITDAAGVFTFADLPSGEYRIEFATPAGKFPAPLGADNLSSVQFVSTGGAAKAAFADPTDFCQADPTIAIVCFAQDFATSGGLPALKTTSYSTTSPTVTDSDADQGPATTRLTMSQVGATYGMAHHRASGTVYQGAFMKRGVALGPDGLNAIYRVSSSTWTVSSGATIPNAGPNRAVVPASPAEWQRDASAFSLPHTTGLGDLDLSFDQQTLYAVNLADNGVYSVPVNADGSLGAPAGPLVPATPADCAPANFKIFGLGIKGAKGYIGGVCNGPAAADLKGYVIPFDAIGTAANAAAPVLTIPLNYTRGEPLANAVTCGTSSSLPGDFLPWASVTSEAAANVIACGDLRSAPQPSISDITFNDRGDLVVGVRDRFADQSGWGLLSSESTLRSPISTAAAGDLLIACVSGTGWVLESNGSCGGRTGQGVGNTEGPGGGEFYGGDLNTYASGFSSGDWHEETFTGSLLRVPGKGQVVTTGYDAYFLDEQMIRHVSDATGVNQEAVRITRSASRTSGLIGKANGLGDLEALCNQAPVEIGNRIWMDTDNDGLQDAGEMGIDGVAVQLWAGDVQVGTTLTAGGGQYLFNGTNVEGGVRPNVTYEIRIPNASGPSKQAVLGAKVLTTANVGAPADDARDSDATTSGTTAIISVPAASIAVPGANNHTFDAGFGERYSLGNRVWLDDGAGGGTAGDGIQNGTEAGIANVSVKLFAAGDGCTPIGSALAMAMTDANGYYRFDGLTAGAYIVIVDVAASAPLAGFESSVGAAEPDSVATDRDDNGIDAVLGSSSVLPGGVASCRVTLGPNGGEPTGETDLSSVTETASTDGHSNLTVDFGFKPVTAVTSTTSTTAPSSSSSTTTTTIAPAVTTTTIAVFIPPQPQPQPTTTLATTTVPAATSSVAATTAAPTTKPVTTVPASTPVTTAAATTDPSVVTVDATPPEAEVESDIAFTGANDDVLLAAGLLLIGLGLILRGFSANAAVGTTSRRRQRSVA
jgi:hypothetical protein